MTDKPDRVPDRIRDIQEAIKNAREDIGDLSKEGFLLDGKTQRAVIESIIVIGEAANSVTRLDPGIEQRPRICGNTFAPRPMLNDEHFKPDPGVDSVIRACIADEVIEVGEGEDVPIPVHQMTGAPLLSLTFENESSEIRA